MTDKIRLRPSSISSFVSCPKQWYEVFINKKISIPSARAALGTGIHKSVEAMWLESMDKKEKIANKSMMIDAGIQSYQEECKEFTADSYDDHLASNNIAEFLIRQGVDAFVQDVLPFTPIPELVEKTFVHPIDHPFIKEIGGTVDYYRDGTIADIKTSKRRITPTSYTFQQSAYNYILEKNGLDIKTNLIQGVVILKSGVSGSINSLEPKREQVRVLMDNLLKRLRLVWEGADPDLIFPGNPLHYLCSPKYCAMHSTCKFVNGVNDAQV